MSKTLVAQLPAMTSSDNALFEKDGGVWGQQRAVRRSQVQTAGLGAAAFAVGGGAWIKLARKNTTLVLALVTPCLALAGAVIGHQVGVAAFPSVACNKETTMMKRVWWAKQCAANWDMSQVKGDVAWEAKHPNSAFLAK
jgi:hypothetical protein